MSKKTIIVNDIDKIIHRYDNQIYDMIKDKSGDKNEI